MSKCRILQDGWDGDDEAVTDEIQLSWGDFAAAGPGVDVERSGAGWRATFQCQRCAHGDPVDGPDCPDPPPCPTCGPDGPPAPPAPAPPPTPAPPDQ